MENEWLDLAYINFDKAILHGQIVKEIRQGDFYMNKEVRIEQVLTQEQKELVEDLNFKQEREMRALLKTFVNVA